MRWMWLAGLAGCWSNPAPAPPSADPVIGDLAIASGPEIRILAITAHGLAVTRTVTAPEDVIRIAWSGSAPIVLLAKSHATGEITAMGYTPLRPVDATVWLCDGDRELVGASPLTGQRLVLPRPATVQTFMDVEGTFDPSWDLLADATGAMWVYSCTRGGITLGCLEGCGHYARVAPRPFAVTEDAPTPAPQFELPPVAGDPPACAAHPGADPIVLAPPLYALGSAVLEGCRATDLHYTVGPHGQVAVFDREQLRVLVRGRLVGAIRGGALVAFRPR